MVSVLRTLQAEWNALVPQAQTLGIRRVRTLNLPLETIEYRRGKLDWLRGEIARLSALSSLTPAVETDLSILTFGVEIEFILADALGTGDSGRQRLVTKIEAAGIRCRSEGYNHYTSETWKLTTDGSVDSSYTRGFELVSPVLRGQDGFEQVQKICEVLKDTGCKVNKKCGLHVHVGARDWQLDTFKNLVRLYSSAEPAIDSFMAPSRRQNNCSYARAMTISHRRLDGATTMAGVASAIFQSSGEGNVRNTGRYRKINLQCYWQHGTVEFRHHQGTVEADKVLNWTRLCLRMCLAAARGVQQAIGLSTLMDVVQATNAERAFFQGRMDFFQTQENRAAQRATRLNERLEAARREGSVRSFETFTEANPFTQTAMDLQRRSTTRR